MARCGGYRTLRASSALTAALPFALCLLHTVRTERSTRAGRCWPRVVQSRWALAASIALRSVLRPAAYRPAVSRSACVEDPIADCFQRRAAFQQTRGQAERARRHIVRCETPTYRNETHRHQRRHGRRRPATALYAAFPHLRCAISERNARTQRVEFLLVPSEDGNIRAFNALD